MADDLEVFGGSSTKDRPPEWEEAEHHLGILSGCDVNPAAMEEIPWHGERDAAISRSIEEAYSRHHDLLCRLVASMLGPPMRRRLDPGEIVSDAFVSLLESIDRGRLQIDPTRDLLPLVLQLTIRQVRKDVEYHTRQKRTPNREEYVEGDGLAFRGRTQEQFAARVDSLGRIIRNLPPELAVVLLLKLMDFTEQEIGDILDCTREKVKNLRDAIRRSVSDVERVFD